MRKRELLFGFGLGLLVAAATVALIQPQAVPVSSQGLTRENLTEAAEALDMVVLSKQEYEELQQEKKVEVGSVPASPQAPEAPSVDSAKAPQQPAVQPPAVDAPEQAEAPAPSAPAEAPAQAENPQTAAPAAAQPPAAAVTKVFSIPYKATAEGVARTLVEEGILQEDNRLVDVLRAQNKLNRIRVGTYELTLPVTEEEIVEMITTPPKS